jgi:hypothetical protein
VVESGGRVSVVSPPQMIPVVVATATSATTKGGLQNLPFGRLETVTPMSLDSVAIPRGRMYAEFWLCDQAGNPMMCLWRDYLQTSGGDMTAGVSSVPGILVYPEWTVRAVVTQTGQGASTRIAFHCHVQTDVSQAAPSSYIHARAPGEGPGEYVEVALAAPAAGANYAGVNVGSKTRALIRGAEMTLTTSATVGTRVPRIVTADSGGNTFSGACMTAGVPASAAANLFYGKGLTAAGASTSTSLTAPTPDVALNGPSILGFGCDNLQAADQFSAGELMFEQWAVP